MTLAANGWTSKLVGAAALFVIAAGLRLGQELFVPLALGVLVSLVLSPLVHFGLRLKLSRVFAVLSVVVLVFGFLGGVGFFMAGQAAALAQKLPEYRSNVKGKLDTLRGPFTRTVSTVQEAVKEVNGGPPADPAKAEPLKKGREPLKVEVVDGPPDPLKLASVVVGPIMTAGASFAVVFLLVIFFLLYQNEIRDRVIRLVGDAEVNTTNQTITEATRGVSRFLFLQAVVNASYGLTLAAGLYAFGVPNALLWGFFAAVLRFVPYVGPVAGGVLPVLLTLAVFPGWGRSLGVAAFIGVLEIVSNNFVEPVVYGKRTGMSPLAVVLAAVFWAWMWGGVGLILAVPLTVCLVSLGRHVPALRCLAIALGDEPTLEPKIQVYQRLLSGRPDEAAELLEKELADGRPFVHVCDATLAGVLRMTQADLQRRTLDVEKGQLLYATLREIGAALAETERARTPPPSEPRGASVLCLPAGDAADEICAYMLSRTLELKGCRAAALTADKTAGEALEEVRAEGPDLLILCLSPLSNPLRARYVYKRLRRRFGEIPIVEIVWGGGDPKAVARRAAPDGKAKLVGSLAEASELASALARELGARKSLRAGAVP